MEYRYFLVSWLYLKYYYSCDDSVVHVTSLNLDDMTISFADTIYGAVCY